MSGFVVPSVVPATPPAAEPVIANDGWFPDIDPARLRSERRIRDQVTAERLSAALLGAIVTVGNQLSAWAAAQAAAGHAALADVPAPALGGESRLVLLYRRAVGAYAHAELVERYRDTDVTGAGQRQIDELEPSIGELKRDGVHAIRDMLGAPRTCVELI